MAALTYFTLQGYVKAIVADYIPFANPSDPENEDIEPQTNDTSGTVTITPYIGDSKPGPNVELQIPTLDTPSVLILCPIRARLDEGRLKLNASQPDVRLVANTAVLGLTEPLRYEVKFSNVTFNGGEQDIAAFRFTAPATDTTVDFATLTRLPND